MNRGILYFLLLALGVAGFSTMGFVAGRFIERKKLEGRIEMEGIWLARYSGRESVTLELEKLYAEIEAEQGFKIQSRWIKAEAAGSDLRFICAEAVDGRKLVVNNDQSVHWRDRAELPGR